jgi:group II intron reverse transcriptase/maturase
MRETALATIGSYAALDRAWRDLLHRSRPYSRNTRGVDGVSINDFWLDPKPHLRRMAAELAQGIYTFSPLRAHLIPKPNGKERLICVPTVQDRIVQRALLDFLTSKYLVRLANPISYGFIRSRTVRDAATVACKRRSKLPWIFKTDITAFFDQIDRTILEKALRRTVRDRSLHRLLIAALQCEAVPSSSSAAKKISAMGIRVGLGVRQGMPLSPLFANVVLQDFDNAIIRFGYSAIRYADDLIFFADSEDACLEIHKVCRAYLGELNLAIPDVGPDSKSRIYRPNEPAEFLGLGLVRENSQYILRLLPNQIERIHREISQLQSIKELLSRRVTLATLGTHIQNRVTGYLSAYEACTNLDDLENVFDQLTQKVLLSIYRDGLKINTGSLSSEAKAFLGLR